MYAGQTEVLDYHPCRYGDARGVFRGPEVSLEKPYTAVVGSSEVYGKYVEDPFTDQLAERTGRRVINFGVMNAGLDAFVQDEALLRLLSRAETVVVQAMGAHNMSNRFYTVHPRRNDRFLKPSKALRTLYRDVDFSDFSFTRHLLNTLRSKSPTRFKKVEQELQAAWSARMQLLLSRLPGRRILLMIENKQDGGLGPEPLFISDVMVQEMSGSLDRTIRCDISDTCGGTHMGEMIYPEMERAAAECVLTPPGHDKVAEALLTAIPHVDHLAA